MLNENCFNCVTCSLSSNEQEQTPLIRHEKIVEIRQKLKSKRYNVDEHLSIAIDRLIEEILS